MLGAVVDHVAPLTERGEVGPGVVGRVVVAVGRSQDHAVRIPMEAGHPFRREAGQRSDLMSATIPR